MKIGFDIDGTIASCSKEGSLEQRIILYILGHCNTQKLARLIIEIYASRLPLLMVPTAPAYFITSRPRWLFATTFNWMSRNGIKPIAIFMASTHISNGKAFARAVEKALVIKATALDIYYEDDPKVRKYLKDLCPETKILEPEEAIKRGHAVWEEDD